MLTRGLVIIAVNLFTLIPFVVLAKIIASPIWEAEPLLGEIYPLATLQVFAVLTITSSMLLIAMVLISFKSNTKKSLIKVCLLIVFVALTLDTAMICSASRFIRFDSRIQDAANKSITQYHKSEPDKQFWDEVNQEGHCCGLGSQSEWRGDTPGSCPLREVEKDGEPFLVLDERQSCVSSLMSNFMPLLQLCLFIVTTITLSDLLSLVLIVSWYWATKKSVRELVQQVDHIITGGLSQQRAIDDAFASTGLY